MTKLRPTVDLGYPTEAYGRIPAFQDIEEEAEFWDTHDTTEFYGRELQPVELSISPEFRGQLTLHLDADDRDALAERARARGVSPATLARDWQVERLHQETAAEAEAVADVVPR